VRPKPKSVTTCAGCRHFEAAPQAIERLMPHLAALSSAHGASRTGDGLCLHHQRHVPATAHCAAAEAR
jgi:hypothetical protein